MSKFATAAIVALLGVSLAGCGQPATSIAPAPAQPTITNALPAAPVASLTQSFLDRSAQTDTVAIAISKTALTKSTSPDVKALAQKLIKDHAETNEQLHAFAAANDGFTLPAALTPDYQGRVDAVTVAGGTGFDDKYLDTVVDAHQAMIGAMKDYLDAGDNASVKAWAHKTLPILTADFDQAKALQEARNKA